MTLMNQAWDDAMAFIRRESALLIPLALATVFLGDVIGTLAQSRAPDAQPSGFSTIVFLIAALWSTVGQLSITALVLRPGSSVGEAIRIGVARLGKLLLIALILAGGFLLAMIPVATALASAGFNPENPQSLSQMPTWAAFYVGLLSVVMLWVVARLLLLNPLIVDRNPGPIAALKSAFGMTRGIAAQILLVLVIYVIVLAILTGAVKFVVGSLAAIIGAAVGQPFLGIVLTALASGLMATMLGLVAAVYIACLYARRDPDRQARATRDVFS
jgi:hypothetical protein